MPLPEELAPYFGATIDRIVPGIADEVLRRLESHSSGFERQLETWLTCLRGESFAVFGQDFLDLHESTQDELLDRIDAENYRTDWKGLDSRAVLQRLVDVAAEVAQLPKRQQDAQTNAEPE